MEDGLKEEQRGTNDVSHVKGLISRKENIEEEIKALLDVLKTVSVKLFKIFTLVGLILSFRSDACV